ncbi:MAG: GreA/GreB family elongation factor [Candidatus Saccharibacteria bacterium]
MEGVYFTKKGLEKLETSIDNHDKKVKDLRRELGEACADDPDLPENIIAKEIRARFHQELPAERQRLIGMRASAILVENSEEFITKSKEVVWIGSKVTYQNINDASDVDTLTILGALESDYDNDVISYDAPIAIAMINKTIGDEFTIGNGNTDVFKIIAIERVLGDTDKTEE